jgi:hypothetical protein
MMRDMTNPHFVERGQEYSSMRFPLERTAKSGAIARPGAVSVKPQVKKRWELMPIAGSAGQHDPSNSVWTEVSTILNPCR